MIRFLLPTGASIAAGLLLGATAAVGVTLMAQSEPETVVQGYEHTAGPNQVRYGDRCDEDDDACFSSNRTHHGSSILP